MPNTMPPEHRQRYQLAPEHEAAYQALIEDIIRVFKIDPEQYAAELERATTIPQGPNRPPYTINGDAESEAIYQCMRHRGRDLPNGYSLNIALTSIEDFMSKHNILADRSATR